MLGFLIQPLSPSTLRKRRFRHQYYDLQISIFNFHGEIPSLLLCPSLISRLGSTIQFPRRSICSMESSFNQITTAAPVATLPHIPILFIPCQASPISDHSVCHVLPASSQLLHVPPKGPLTSYPDTKIKISHLLSSFWPLTLINLKLLCPVLKFPLCCIVFFCISQHHQTLNPPTYSSGCTSTTTLSQLR